MALYTSRTVIFNGVSLHSLTGVSITGIDASGIPQKNIQDADIAESDGKILVNTLYGDKTINMVGEIEATDMNTAEGYRDTLLGYLTPTNATLVFEQSGTDRKYYATLKDAIFSGGKGGSLHFDINFTCSDPFGYSANQLQTVSAGLTTSPNATVSATNSGNYKLYPIIRYKLNSFTGADNRSVQITTDSIGITVLRTWSAGEVLTIDGVNKTVKIGSTEIDYTGVFPLMQTGSNTFTVTDSFTARNFDLTILYTNRWL